MNILFASFEATPFAKAGGLGDVAGSLPMEIAALGHDIRLIMPKYKSIPQSFSEEMTLIDSFYIDIGIKKKYVGIFQLKYKSITAYFIDNQEYFGSDTIYSYFYNDEAERSVYFSRAVIESITKLDFYPDIMHCNDWHTALIPVLLKSYTEFYNMKSLFTIHNLQYQGIFDLNEIKRLTLLPDDYFTIDSLEFYNSANLMKGGILFSDYVNTVSERYAREILTPEYGEKLEKVLGSRENNFCGIINGVDYDEYNPKTDSQIKENYTPYKLEGKSHCKRAIIDEFNISSSEHMLIGMVTRLTHQKGIDLLCQSADSILTSTDISIILLGSGDAYLEKCLYNLAERYPSRVGVRIGYDDSLARKIYAGSDVFLMPSRFEPCGISQLIAMKYGALPLVHETGGLADTVLSYNEYNNSGWGFSFAMYSSHDLEYTIKRAISFYRQDDLWQKLTARAMKKNYSWKRSAMLYVSLYEQILHKK